MAFRSHKEKDDKELLELYQKDSDPEWLGILLQRYTLLLFGVCMKYLKNEEAAKDGVQHVFLTAINELSKYKVEYFKSWLYMIAKNHCLMILRKKGNHTREIDERVMAAYPETKLEEHISKNNDLDRLAEALNQLNKEQKECVTLFYLEKKSYQQITKITGYTMLQVKSYIQNGKRNIRLLMERQQHEK